MPWPACVEKEKRKKRCVAIYNLCGVCAREKEERDCECVRTCVTSSYGYVTSSHEHVTASRKECECVRTCVTSSYAYVTSSHEHVTASHKECECVRTCALCVHHTSCVSAYPPPPLHTLSLTHAQTNKRTHEVVCTLQCVCVCVCLCVSFSVCVCVCVFV